MFEKTIKTIKYVFEKISENFTNILIDKKRFLEENNFYCFMTNDNSLKNKNVKSESIKSESIESESVKKYISENNEIKIKNRMESYRK
jgi:hypothetical protein